MTDIIIIDNISKKFRIGERRSYNLSLKEYLSDSAKKLKCLLLKSTKKERPEFWALKNVSFSLKEGEAVALVGRNGSGKSTLLKILSRITEPTKGQVILRRKVSSLLEVGTGFHPDLTGRENIFLNGSILGMKTKEIKLKFDSIVNFSEVEEFLDTPVRHYSSGMYMKLAFSIAAHLDPEVLIVDKVLAVGDAQFQEKCIGVMNRLRQEGKSIIFVSHNMDSVRSVCSRAIFLENGQVIADGPTETIAAIYSQKDNLVECSL